MATKHLHAVAPQPAGIAHNLSVWIPDAQCRLVVSEPALDRAMWNEYLDGALRTYSKHGVECTLNFDAICDGSDTRMFLAMVDGTGRVVGGARVIGPLRSADETHAVVEWAGNVGEPTVRRMINDRLPFGVVEVKALWADSKAHRSGSITTALARIPSPIMALLDVKFVMATAAAHVIDRWTSSGGVVADNIPAVIYPDERYRTKMMWWDRSTLANLAEPQQLSRMVIETRKLVRDAEGSSKRIRATAGAGQ